MSYWTQKMKASYAQDKARRRTIASPSIHRQFRGDWESGLAKASSEVSRLVSDGWTVDPRSPMTKKQAEKIAKKRGDADFKQIPVAKWMDEEIVYLLYKEKPKPKVEEKKKEEDKGVTKWFSRGPLTDPIRAQAVDTFMKTNIEEYGYDIKHVDFDEDYGIIRIYPFTYVASDALSKDKEPTDATIKVAFSTAKTVVNAPINDRFSLTEQDIEECIEALDKMIKKTDFEYISFGSDYRQHPALTITDMKRLFECIRGQKNAEIYRDFFDRVYVKLDNGDIILVHAQKPLNPAKTVGLSIILS